MLIKTDTNYPQDSDFQVMDEVDRFFCVIPHQVVEATMIEAKRIQDSGVTASSGDCDCIKTVSIGSVTITKKDSCDESSQPEGFEKLLEGFVCWTYKMP